MRRFCLYLALAVCLIPGVRNRELIEVIRQYVVNFWNSKSFGSSKIKNQ
jgi:hypothetical protein